MSGGGGIAQASHNLVLAVDPQQPFEILIAHTDHHWPLRNLLSFFQKHSRGFPTCHILDLTTFRCPSHPGCLPPSSACRARLAVSERGTRACHPTHLKSSHLHLPERPTPSQPPGRVCLGVIIAYPLSPCFMLGTCGTPVHTSIHSLVHPTHKDHPGPPPQAYRF
jgi:hypothetical protein